MGRSNCFIVSVFLVFTLAISGMVFGQRVIDLDKVWGDMRVLGDDADDYSGGAVAYGDINGDGFMDIIIGAAGADPGDPPRDRAGETYVIFGSSLPPSYIDLSIESADITVCGAYADDMCGGAVASGDINSDGYYDLIICAPWAEEVYVIFGASYPSPPYIIDLNAQSAGITVYGGAAGYSAASGDVNSDGFDDIIIGAPFASPPGRTDAGKTYVIFGSSSPPSTIDLDSQLADITVYGCYEYDYSGKPVISADINGDGYEDIIIAAPSAGYFTWEEYVPQGYVYVIFGSNFTPPVVIDAWQADMDFNGHSYDYLGSGVASGDLNSDNYDDLIMGAPGADSPGREDSGTTYVVFGSGSPSEIIGVTIYGDDTADHSGGEVASGDVNGDGYDDIIIGAGDADTPGGNMAGETYVIFGSSSLPSTIDLSTESANITVYGDDAIDLSAFSLASGDVNNDGYSDLIIGASNADPPGGNLAGETYLLSGGGTIITAHGLGGKSWIKEFSLLGRIWGGFKAFGAVNSQGEVHVAVGDIDGDEYDEIIAGHGEGAKSWVKFFEVDGSPISGFKAFGVANTNGEVHLAIGNFDTDPSDKEIAVAHGEGGQSWVKLFEIDGTLIRSFKSFGVVNAQGEVHLASGDLNKDGIDEIIAGMGEGGSSWVKVFNLWGDFIRSFKAFDATDNPGGEVHLAVGNFDADADVEIAVATGYNGGNKVRLFDKYGTLMGEFTAFGFGGNPNGEVHISAADMDNDGIDEIICGHGEGGSSMVKVFQADGTFIRSFKAFGAVNAQGEVHLAKSNY